MARSVWSYLAFVGIFSALVALVDAYLWYRLVRSPGLGPVYERWGTRVAVTLALLTPASLGLALVLPRRLTSIVAFADFGWIGLAILLLFTLLGAEVLRGAALVAGSIAGAPLDPGRRALLSRAIALGAGVLGLALGASGLASALGEIRIRRLRIPLRRLPAASSGFLIAQITDLHVGSTIGRAYVEGVVARINALEPDVIAITGDLVDGSVADLAADVAPLAGLCAKHGVYFVTGNHEYYSGVEEWLVELERLGIRVLRNERVAIGEGPVGFDLAGVDDLSAHRHGQGHGADLEGALAGRDETRELVLLAHQPKQVLEASRLGVGLQLSGHTHGGQIFPWGLVVQLDQPYVKGLVRHEGTFLHVSNGTGYWGPPMRVGAPPEIVLVELASEPA